MRLFTITYFSLFFGCVILDSVYVAQNSHKLLVILLP